MVHKCDRSSDKLTRPSFPFAAQGQQGNQQAVVAPRLEPATRGGGLESVHAACQQASCIMWQPSHDKRAKHGCKALQMKQDRGAKHTAALALVGCWTMHAHAHRPTTRPPPSHHTTNHQVACMADGGKGFHVCSALSLQPGIGKHGAIPCQRLCWQ